MSKEKIDLLVGKPIGLPKHKGTVEKVIDEIVDDGVTSKFLLKWDFDYRSDQVLT